MRDAWRRLLGAACILAAAGCARTAAPPGVEPAPAPGPRRVVGYLPTWRDLDAAAARFGDLTHLNLAFANPTQGNVPDPGIDDSTLARVVDRAHAAGTRVLISVGGGLGTEAFAARLTADNVPALVAATTAWIVARDLDGLDVDIEGASATTPEYADFVRRAAAALHAEDRLLTAALATWFVDDVADDVLAAFDFINVMSYDHCGPWTGPCEQATYDAAVRDLGVFTARGQPADRLVLGVPFYAWCWGEGCPGEALTRGELLRRFPQAAAIDWIETPDMKLSGNGTATLERKRRLALAYGGIMVWEIGQDAAGEASLLTWLTRP